MERPKVVEAVAQRAKRATGNRPANQNQEATDPAAKGSNSGRRENQEEDEETKANDLVDESKLTDKYDERGANDTPAATQVAPASTNDDGAAMVSAVPLTAALLQKVTTMTRIDARPNQPSSTMTNPAQFSATTDVNTQVVTTQQPSVTTTNSPASMSVQQVPTAPVAIAGQPRDEPATTVRTVVFQSRDDGGDSSDGDDSSSSSSDDDSDGNDADVGDDNT
ncbi:Hypothetical protein PHPALM_1613 [Phytophthora palmivora]|uniref:Uncharacterized protein n=1 Tax=Phytophthora palmivora TaxID=4796 RepID=A0A2P4YS04_9STRA|nr:Hypothetical protein PHPALM_1613 [Phytophthora palmivora]